MLVLTSACSTQTSGNDASVNTDASVAESDSAVSVDIAWPEGDASESDAFGDGGGCGTANAVPHTARPADTELCVDGVAPPVSGDGPWQWSCGTTACIAPLAAALAEDGIGSIDVLMGLPWHRAGDNGTHTALPVDMLNSPSTWPTTLAHLRYFLIGAAEINTLATSTNPSLQDLVQFLTQHDIKLVLGSNVTVQGDNKLLQTYFPSDPYPRYAVDPTTHQQILVNNQPVVCGQQVPTNDANPPQTLSSAIMAIQAVGGKVDYINWDEPLNGGYEYWHNGARGGTSYGCQWTMQQVAYMVQQAVVAGAGVNTNPALKYGEWIPFGFHPPGQGSDSLTPQQRIADVEQWEPLLTVAQGNQTVAWILGDDDLALDQANYENQASYIVGQLQTWLNSSYGRIPLVSNCAYDNGTDNDPTSDQVWGTESIASCQIAESVGAVHSMIVFSNWWSEPVPSQLIPESGTNQSINYSFTDDILQKIQARDDSAAAVGTISAVQNGVVLGWACQPENTTPVEVAVYAGDPANGGVLLVNQYAADPSTANDTQTACQSPGTNFEFNVVLTPAQLTSNAGKKVYVIAGPAKNTLTNSGTFGLP